MINAGKVFANIALQNVGTRSAEMSKFSEGFMSAKTRPVGVGMGNKCFFKNGCNNIAEGVVNYSIAVGCGGNETGLRIDDFEGVIFAREIGLVDEFLLELKKFRL